MRKIYQDYRKSKIRFPSYLRSLIKRRARGKNLSEELSSLKIFREWMYANSYEELFDNWASSDYDAMLKPSVDRLDSYKGYTYNNIQLGTWRQNLDNAQIDPKVLASRKKKE